MCEINNYNLTFMNYINKYYNELLETKLTTTNNN